MKTYSKNTTTFSYLKTYIIFLLLLSFASYFGTINAFAYEEEGDNGNDYVTVYYTNTGDCYHRENCSYLKSKHPTTLYNAVNGIGTPGGKKLYGCSRCNPPELGYPQVDDEAPYKSSGSSYSGSSNSYSSSSGSSNSYSSGSNTQASTNNNSNENSFPYGVLGGVGAAAVGLAGISAANNKIKREKEEEKERTSRASFKNNLNSQRIRDKAGVPSYIYFFEGLPKDNNNKKYGSFTYYVSKSGKCYHQIQGCCSARYAIHSFKAVKRYDPCSKCCKTVPTIPEWYNRYERLVYEAKKLGFDSSDQMFNTDSIMSSVNTNISRHNEEKRVSETRFVKKTDIKSSTDKTNKKELLICPKCGGLLVVRTAKRGYRPGSQFYGCSNFPECRYTRNIN